ncbi:MAG TPA: PepSY domain-containing protein [Chitinophagaceae bacterium]|nr:PepSY domain-containing protein [Chitinophagaceae bacterium]
MYRWHRITSLIIAIPVLLWAVSGFMHPVMTNFRPKLGTQFISPQPIASAQLQVSLKEALLKNNIDTFSNFRIVQMGGYWFYQVQIPGQRILRYISAQTGMPLRNGDELYARSLARQFLTGRTKAADTLAEENVHDCCKNAATAIIKDTAGAKVSGVELIEHFNSEYKYINRLLPVYKVSFERKDGIRIYVETQQDRFAFAMNDTRAAFDKFFSLFHTWSWLDFLGKGRLVAEISLALMALLTTIMGICIFFSTKTKKPNGNTVVAARRNHRWVSIVISLFTLMFTFSGAFHAFSKFKPDTRDNYYVKNNFTPAEADLNYTRLQAAIGAEKTITGVSLVRLNGKSYWQVFSRSNDKARPSAERGKDLMKNKSVPLPNTIYIDEADYKVLQEGEMQYARFLATRFSGNKATDILSATPVIKFTDEYNFTDKRLPVWKIVYAGSNRRYYIETSTGKLSKSISNEELVEDYSFALLHKHEFLGVFGKPVKDFSTMFWALSQVVMITTGLILYSRSRRRKVRS